MSLAFGLSVWRDKSKALGLRQMATQTDFAIWEASRDATCPGFATRDAKIPRHLLVKSMFVKLVAHLALIACACAFSRLGAADDRPVVIGAMYNLTGGQHTLDKPSSEGARLAVDQANAAAGVLGRQVHMVLVTAKPIPR